MNVLNDIIIDFESRDNAAVKSGIITIKRPIANYF